MSIERFLPACCLVAAACVLGGYVVVARVQLNAFDLIKAVTASDTGVVLAVFALIGAWWVKFVMKKGLFEPGTPVIHAPRSL